MSNAMTRWYQYKYLCVFC